MGKPKKAEKVLDNQCSDIISERYRPFLIHFSTYTILTDQILTLMPSQRNVLLSMNEYELHKINPTHPKNSDSPTHVILFCIRFIADDTFQPIGGLLTYKQVDQSIILAECVKAYINDLWKLNLHVVATVSPPFKVFKDILGHLVLNKNFDKHSDVISYSVEPIKEIIHIYDVQFLFIKLQNLLREGDIMFQTKYQGNKVLTACWEDISVIMNIAPEFKMISDFLSSKENVQRRVHIFTEQIFIKYIEVKTKGLLSAYAEGGAELLNAVRAFLKFFENDFVYPPEHVLLNWSDLIYILKTMSFQKIEENKCDTVNSSSLKREKFMIAKKKNKKNKDTTDKDISSTNTNDKDSSAVNNELSSIYELCEMLRKQKSFDLENEVSNSTNSKTDAFDLKAALQKMDCDINLVKYDNKKVSIENKNHIQYNNVSKECDEDDFDNNKKENEIIQIQCIDEDKIVDNNSSKEKTENSINYEGNCENYLENCQINLNENCITKELICTVKGIKQLMSLMASRRVRQIKPDALIVEHIDYLVTQIQSSINRIASVHYYGHPYKFMDTDLAFATLTNTKGLYLISKD